MSPDVTFLAAFLAGMLSISSPCVLPLAPICLAHLAGVSAGERGGAAATSAGQNGASFLAPSDPDEADTGGAYPIFNFPTHIFIDADGIVRSIVLEGMDTEQALGEVAKIHPVAAGDG